jgi:hypothetical protein
MQTRYRAAATALLLTATAGLAATGGAAEASGTHHTSDRAVGHLTITITTTKSGPKLSSSTFRPGKTMFRVVHGNSGGEVQVLRLRSGYSLAKAERDFGKAFSGDVHAVRRIDSKVVFYGGMTTPRKGDPAARWGTDIDKAGTYYVVNLDKNNLSTFRAKGTHQRRALPSADGHINIAAGNNWKPGANNPNKGWMKTSNGAKEPHFVDLAHVKQSTTEQQVSDFFAGGAQGRPSFVAADGFETSTGLISPGHTFVWKYHAPKGKYVVMCFWSSKVNGMPHALMGMWKLTQLG